jgi:nucleoside-diphosphate-sugar epimerase
MSSTIGLRRALVIGITGGIGGEVASALLQHGWQVHAMHRNPGSLQLPPALQGQVHLIAGDAMNADDVARAAAIAVGPRAEVDAGSTVIVHAVNPPKYKNWKGLVLPMLENTIAAARETSARIVLPATVYNFGTDAPAKIDESARQSPHTRKGRIRVEMEERLKAAAHDGVRSLVVRAGDFFGPNAGNNWFVQGLLGGRKRVGRVLYPGPRDIGHSWAYLPDLAQAIAQLLEPQRTPGASEVFHFKGHWLPSGVAMAEAICGVLGIPERRISAFPWWAVTLAAPFVEVCREMLEMRYLWRAPMELDNSKLRAALGSEPHTPLGEAVQRTIAAAGVTAS